jgi:hypothetical protein
MRPRIKINKSVKHFIVHPISPLALLLNKSAMIAVGPWPTPAAPLAGDCVKPVEGSMRKRNGSTEHDYSRHGLIMYATCIEEGVAA